MDCNFFKSSSIMRIEKFFKICYTNNNEKKKGGIYMLSSEFKLQDLFDGVLMEEEQDERLTEAKAKEILSNIPSGAALSVSSIQTLVESTLNYAQTPLTPEDNAPYTNTRKTKYPHWKHEVQKALYHLKENGTIQYNADTHVYTF